MPIFAKIQSFVRNLFSSRRVEADLTQEVHAHLEMLREENVRAGMAPREAERAALLELGGIEQVKEQVREQRLGNWLHSVMSDCRFGLRQLRKSPGFTLIAILTLMLGIGANTALFSVVNGVLLNPLPFPHSEQLAILYQKSALADQGAVSYLNFLDWQRQNETFLSMAAFREQSFNLTGEEEPTRLSGHEVSADFFPTLEVKPVLGRLFTADEDRVGGEPVALIGGGLWN